MCNSCGLIEVTEFGTRKDGPSFLPNLPEDSVCLYALLDPREDVRIAYVGQSQDPLYRYGSHMAEAWRAAFDTRRRNKRKYGEVTRKEGWLLDVIDLGLSPNLLLLEFVDGSDKKEAEAKWRKHWRDSGWYLTNSEGIALLSITPDERKDIGARQRGKPKEMPPSQGVAISKANKGKRHSAETIAVLKEKALLRWQDPEYRKVMVAAAQARGYSPKRAEALREVNARPEIKAAQKAGMDAYWATKTPKERSEIARKREQKKREKRQSEGS